MAPGAGAVAPGESSGLVVGGNPGGGRGASDGGSVGGDGGTVEIHVSFVMMCMTRIANDAWREAARVSSSRNALADKPAA